MREPEPFRFRADSESPYARAEAERLMLEQVQSPINTYTIAVDADQVRADVEDRTYAQHLEAAREAFNRANVQHFRTVAPPSDYPYQPFFTDFFVDESGMIRSRPHRARKVLFNVGDVNFTDEPLPTVKDIK